MHRLNMHDASADGCQREGFSITGDYTCPANVSQIYMVATGGNPGITKVDGSGHPVVVNNSNLALMAALGPCPANGNLLASLPYIIVNEVTTVSAVWALQQFMAPPATGNVGAPAIGAPGKSYSNNLASPTSVQTAVIGLKNAFTTAKVMADVATGLSPNAHYAYATPESAKINTFADILSYCVNSDPTATTNCSNLMTAATPSGAPAAQDTIQAAWYMAQNPSNNYATLYGFVAAGAAPFIPTLATPTATQPGDFTIAINYAPTYNNGGTATYAIDAPFSVAIDAYGNAWFANNGGIANSAIAGGTELGADGSVITNPVTSFTPCAAASCGSIGFMTTGPAAGAHSFSAPKVVAIDLTNNAWIANSTDPIAVATVPSSGTVAVLNGSSATGIGGSGSTGYYVNYTPIGMAIDGSNNVFVSSGTTSGAGSTLLGARSTAKLAAADGSGFIYSNSASNAAPNSTGGGQALLAIDTNTNVGAGGMVWALNFNDCKIKGNYAAITPWGTINEYMASNLSSPNGSEMATSYSGATVGAGSATNCGSTNYSIGQVLTAGMANPFGIGIDHNNGAYISDVLTSSLGFDGITYITAPTSATGVSPSSYSVVDGSAGSSTVAPTAGTTLKKAGALVVDGNGRAWIPNQSANSIVEAGFNGSGFTFYTPPPANGNPGVGFIHPTTVSNSGAVNSTGIAIDPSGNVWVTNASTSVQYTNQLGTTNNVGNSATVIVGAAAPVVTPLSLAVANNALGVKP